MNYEPKKNSKKKMKVRKKILVANTEKLRIGPITKNREIEGI